ncbi:MULTISPECIES: alpha-amylase family glycosyl hydrolase [Clostridium]|uniref:Alpha-amylase n=1 Tax=Clostridium cibarium TaxID=2762247 RepID=A0ABR8PRB7_9CLOT|nr:MULTISPECIES: alpha-amylase family glycosyl hydrolase [Clostridium]MBD7910714.1 alpha-amylase [Clostridium cibarium]
MNEWINESIFYHIYPLGFCGAPKINNEKKSVNRINKVLEWIPHLKKLSINAIYFGPIFESSEHGYDTKDYFMIDKRLGTNIDFKKVCKELHKEDIKIVLDGVFNHVGREFWAFEDLKKNREKSLYINWFKNVNFNEKSPMGDDFTYEGWNGHYNLVKLNIMNKEVMDYIFEVIKFWIEEFEIDGLRLDAADYMDRNFFECLNTFCKSKKNDFWLMGEVIHGDYKLWANEKMLDSVTNYECYKGIYSSHNEKNYFEIAYSMNRQHGNFGIYKDLHLYNFVDNHDVNRIASTLKDKKHLYNVYTLLYCMPGIPSIYYGSEWGLEGIKHDGLDDDLRPSLDINNILNKNEKLYLHIKKLGKLRRELEVIRNGDFSEIVTKNFQLIFKRSYNGKNIYVVLNLSDKEEKLEFRIGDNKKLVNRLNEDEIIKVLEGKVSIMAKPYDSKILEEQET